MLSLVVLARKSRMIRRVIHPCKLCCRVRVHADPEAALDSVWSLSSETDRLVQPVTSDQTVPLFTDGEKAFDACHGPHMRMYTQSSAESSDTGHVPEFQQHFNHLICGLLM